MRPYVLDLVGAQLGAPVLHPVLLLVLAGLTIAALAVSAEPRRPGRHAAPRCRPARPPALQLRGPAAGRRLASLDHRHRHRAAAAGLPVVVATVARRLTSDAARLELPVPEVANRVHA